MNPEGYEKMKYRYCLFFLILVTLNNCVELYEPSVITQETHYLVVDGFINSSDNSARINLSRTIPLYSEVPFPRESNAIVNIEDHEGSRYPLTEKGNGLYETFGIPVDIQKQYRLHIRTSDNQEYFSQYVPVKISPPIDSVFWLAENDGIRIYLNTHDDSGTTKYYKWSYSEIWEYRSPFFSAMKLVNSMIMYRQPEEYIHRCWSSDISNNILISSSVKLKQDVISHYPLLSIEKGNKKIGQKYSILVTQQAITAEAYEYWLQLQHTTESLGGLFDPMPYEVTGNIYNASSPSEPVMGFFTAGAVQEKRILIDAQDLPDHLRFHPHTTCLYDTIPASEITLYDDKTLLIASYGVTDDFGVPEGYLTSDDACIDCRVHGGTTAIPPFWE